jgi:peptidoglycan/LPS O-acetylase OafA/YrhL
LPEHKNNFDLIRLLAALQVFQVHAVSALHLPAPSWLGFIINQLPGVPIFFLVSGYLVAMSLLRGQGGTASYFARRALRIYPALWINIGLIVAALIVTGSLSLHVTSWRFDAWLAAALALGNDIYPSFLFGKIVDPNGFYVTFPSGVLWTIPVELGFYVLLPLILLKRQSGGVHSGWLILLFGAGSLALGVLLQYLKAAQPEALVTKLLVVTTPAYLWYFLIGTGCAVYWPRLRTLFEGRLGTWLIIHFGLALIDWRWLGNNSIDFHTMTPILPIRVLTLAGLVFSFAFTFRTMSSRLNGTDISYGIYLYHAPIIWTLVALHRQDDGSLWAMVLAPTILLALVSWFVIERPALRMKAVTDVLLSSKARGPAAKNR